MLSASTMLDSEQLADYAIAMRGSLGRVWLRVR